MNYLILIVTLLNILLADDVKESNFNISGIIMTYYSTMNYKMSDDTEKDTAMYYASTQLNIDYTNKGFYFQATPYIYAYSSKDGEEIKNIANENSYEKSSLFFRSLYMSYTFNTWTLGVGVLPFMNSMPMQFGDDTIQNGVGLNTLNDNTLMSIFCIYKTADTKTIFGVGTLEQDVVETGNYISDRLREDTKIYFLINIYKNDKFIFTNELMYSDIKYNSVDSSDIYLYGLGISWDDSMDSGLVLYNVAGASMNKNNSTNAKDEIFTNIFGSVEKGEAMYAAFPNSFAIDNETYYGASNLLGLRYEMDMFPLETFINIEWFRTFGDWTSGNQGNNIFDGKINQMYNIRDNAYYINFGILTSKNSMLRFTYSYLEFDEFGKIGASASTIPNEDLFGGKKIVRDVTEVFHIIFTYRF